MGPIAGPVTRQAKCSCECWEQNHGRPALSQSLMFKKNIPQMGKLRYAHRLPK